MFIRLCLAETGGAFYANVDRILYFGKMRGATAVHFSNGEVRRVRETPVEILKALAGIPK
jgi:hypothetical protein